MRVRYFKPGDRVLCVTGNIDANLKENMIYTVAVVVHYAVTNANHHAQGLMLQPQDTLSPYPYIWPFENFMLCIKAKP